MKMICKVCNKVPSSAETDDCFEKALDILKQHYTYYKNALVQRDQELQQIKERNEKLNKALQLIQSKEPPAKRFKCQQRNDSWLDGHNSSQDNVTNSDISITDDERLGATNLNMALNSEQLFDTSALSQSKNDVSLNTASEMVQTTQVKESPKRNKQRDDLLRLKSGFNKCLEKSKSEWQSKERTSSPVEKSWTMKGLQATKIKATDDKANGEIKTTTGRKLKLSLNKTNPSKMKQSLIPFNKSKENSFRESDNADDIIDASPVIPNKNSKACRSWTHRSGQNSHINNSSNNNNNSDITNVPTNKTNKTDDSNATIDEILFDFSPTKKPDSQSSSLDFKSPQNIKPKQLKYDNDMSTDCTALPNDPLSLSSKSDTSSVLILTPKTQDIIFVDDTCNEVTDIDTMDLMADNLDFLKEIETKYIQKQQQAKQQDIFKKPLNKLAPDEDINNVIYIKKEKVSQVLKQEDQEDSVPKDEKPTCSNNNNNTKSKIVQNPLFSSDELDTEEDDEDFMPKPFIIKQEPDSIKTNKKLTIKERFNIDCEDCEKLINFLDKGLTDAQIRLHLDKCKRHNNNNNGDFMRQNSPEGFWNPFILSFQADDPRNEVLIDKRLKDIKK